MNDADVTAKTKAYSLLGSQSSHRIFRERSSQLFGVRFRIFFQSCVIPMGVESKESVCTRPLPTDEPGRNVPPPSPEKRDLAPCCLAFVQSYLRVAGIRWRGERVFDFRALDPGSNPQAGILHASFRSP